jgi:hypothetical protein
MWNMGRSPSTTSSGPSGTAPASWSRFADRQPWVSTAAFGAPAVPLVKSSAAVADGGTSATGADAPPISSDARTAPATSAPSDAHVATRRPSRLASTPAHAAAPASSTTTTPGCTTSSSRCSSAAGLMGFNGTAAAPAPIVASHASTKVGLFPHSSATRPPGAVPFRTSALRMAAVRWRSSP